MMTGFIQDQNIEKHIEKQIGCMSGFLHIFDRQQILSGKRIYSSTKRLPPPTSYVKTVKAVQPVQPVQPVKLVNEKDIVNAKPIEPVSTGVLENVVANTNTTPSPKSWKFCKEMPRLSLDSRATVDSKGSLCKKEIGDQGVRSPSVIARLMGLEQLPSDNCPSPESVEKPVLRRSASESRVSRDLFHSRFNETGLTTQTNQTETNLNVASRNVRNGQKIDSVKTSQWRPRSFFDSGDFFPEPKPSRTPVYDSGKKMKLRGIDDQSKDLEALKHILEALQLKGLLHSKKPLNRNIVYDPSFDSNVVSTKAWRSPVANRRFGNNIGSANNSPAVSPRSGRSPVRARVDSNLRNGNSIVKRKPLSVETQRSFNERNSPINSPKLNSVANRSPIRRKPTENVYSNQKVNKIFLTEDETSSSSVSSGSTTSHSDRENRDGKSLLQRCDKLLQNIAEFNALNESQHSGVIPSPVSVLDSVFDKDYSSSPSPVMKRTLDFKDLSVDLEDEIWNSIISPTRSTNADNEFISSDSDFTYISDILEASKYLSDESNVFSFLEKQQYFLSKGSKLHRKLVFDVITEIVDRKRELPPWNSVWVTDSSNSVKKICLEFQKIREPEKSDNLTDTISPALKKDLDGNNRWTDHPLETSEAVLYIERLIFKDLVSETIQDLAEIIGKTTFLAPRRKLVF